jgi:predicted nucleic acid-binding protein
MEEQFILDTNILVLAIRDSPIWKTIKTKYALDMDNAYISVVSKAEILSLAAQLDWGEEKMSNLLSCWKI